MLRSRFLLLLVLICSLTLLMACSSEAKPTGTPIPVSTIASTREVVAQGEDVGPRISPAVAVTLDPATTALLMLDFTNVICAPRNSCVTTLPAAAELLGKARDSNVLVIYSDTPSPDSKILGDVEPGPNDPQVTGRADKFFGTSLDDILKEKGIKTVLISGYAANGAVLYTTFGANLRGYTAVVAQDTIASEDPFAVLLTRYQLLNQPGFSNPLNEPLEPGRVTLSESDLVTFHPVSAMLQPTKAPPEPTAISAQLPTVTFAPAATATSAPVPTETTIPPTSAPIPMETTIAPTTAPVSPTEASTSDAIKPKSSGLDMDKVFPPGEGRQLVLDNCLSCHSVAPVVVYQKTRGEWMSTALNHRDMVSALSDEDYALLYEYLIANFNDTSEVPELPDELLKGFTEY